MSVDMETEAYQDGFEAGMRKKQRILDGRGVGTSWANQINPSWGMLGAGALSMMTGNPLSLTNAALIGAGMNVASSLYAGATASSSTSSTSSSTQKKQFLYGQGAQLSGKALKQFERDIESGRDPYEASKRAFSTEYGTYVVRASGRVGIRGAGLHGGLTHVGEYSGISTSVLNIKLSGLYDMATVSTTKGRDGDLIDCQLLNLSLNLQQVGWSAVLSSVPANNPYDTFSLSLEKTYRVVVFLCRDVYGTAENYEDPTTAFAEVVPVVQVSDKMAGKIRVLHIEDVVMETNPEGGRNTFSQAVDNHRLDLDLAFGEEDIAVWDLGASGQDHTKCTRPEVSVAIFELDPPGAFMQEFMAPPSGFQYKMLTDSGVLGVVGPASIGVDYDAGSLRVTCDARLNYKK